MYQSKTKQKAEQRASKNPEKKRYDVMIILNIEKYAHCFYANAEILKNEPDSIILRDEMGEIHEHHYWTDARFHERV